jgi:hypothetical protein
MTQPVTYLAPEDAAMWTAAGLAQLPRVPFQQVKTVVEPADETPLPRSGSDGMDDRLTSPCRCGCGQSVAHAGTGRPGLYASSACRMRALRARRRAEEPRVAGDLSNDPGYHGGASGCRRRSGWPVCSPRATADVAVRCPCGSAAVVAAR